jgi:c-di-GMP-binding flagellar brake protein YcgR
MSCRAVNYISKTSYPSEIQRRINHRIRILLEINHHPQAKDDGRAIVSILVVHKLRVRG